MQKIDKMTLRVLPKAHTDKSRREEFGDSLDMSDDERDSLARIGDVSGWKEGERGVSSPRWDEGIQGRAQRILTGPARCGSEGLVGNR